MSSLDSGYGLANSSIIGINEPPVIGTEGFSGPNSDSTSFTRELPKYVVRTSEISRDSMAFKKSTDQITGVAYERMFKPDPRAKIKPEQLARLDIEFNDTPPRDKQVMASESPLKKSRHIKQSKAIIEIPKIEKRKMALNGDKSDNGSRPSSRQDPYADRPQAGQSP